MTTLLPAGLRVAVRVPASSANLGPGFDCLGLALGIYDDLTVTTTDEPGVRLSVTGEGADSVPFDDTHLVARAVARGLSHAGAAAVGLQIDCVNAIPHSRGVGSSAAAVVSGLLAASGLLGIAPEHLGAQPLSDADLVQLSGEFEGHPDNAAASVLGGAVVTWTDGEGDRARYCARRLKVDPRIRATAFISHTESATAHTRGLRPSADLVAQLRAAGYAATISGAGPTVLVLHTADLPASAAQHPGFTMVETAISDGPTVVDAR
jgi:homoserine kinase